MERKNFEITKRTPRAYIVLADDRAHDEILEFLRVRAYLVFMKSASTPCHKLVVKEEWF